MRRWIISGLWLLFAHACAWMAVFTWSLGHRYASAMNATTAILSVTMCVAMSVKAGAR